MKKRQNVQLFTVRPEAHENNVEVNATLVSYEIKDSCLVLQTKEDDRTLWTHIFPWHNVSMMRISDHD